MRTRSEPVFGARHFICASAVEGGSGRNEIYRELRDLPQRTGPAGLLVVSIASHGFSESEGDYVLAANSVRGLIATSGLQLEKVLTMVGKAPAKRQLVLIDACREKVARGGSDEDSDEASAEAAALAPSFAAAVDKTRGMAVLMGASAGGFAYDDFKRQNGVFTGALIDGLRGGASADARGFVTIDLLAEYVHGKVRAWVREHRPLHVEKSRGIKSVIDGDVAHLPLAMDPGRVRALLDFAARRALALERLKANQSPGGTITGTMYDLVGGLLTASQEPTAFAREVLEELEKLDGEEQARRAFAWFVGQHGACFGGMAAPPSVPVGGRAKPRTASLGGSAPVKKLAAGELWVDPKFGLRFRQIPAGTFLMGSPSGESGRYSEEAQHEVKLTRSFLLGETEVTQAQWRRLMETDPSYFSSCGDACPVEQVSWWEALEFANRMSSESAAGLSSCYRLSGCTGTLGGGCSAASTWWCVGDYSCEAVELVGDCTGYRLPTEAEWEYAARAGTMSARYSSDLSSIAWSSVNSKSKKHPVSKKVANAWNLRDMLGNVWEWNWDWFGAYAVSTAGKAAVDPLGAKPSPYRVVRGCSWDFSASGCRAANRDGNAPVGRSSDVGLRLARTYP